MLTLLMLLPLFPFSVPASAAEYVKGANGASDSYRGSIYYKQLLAVPITGDGRTDVLAVALSQLGYKESDTSGDFGGTTGGTKNFTEYNYNFGKYNDVDGYGNKYYWCASFVSFCLLQARCHNYTKLADWCRAHKDDPAYIWREISCVQWADQLRKHGYFQNSEYRGGTYTPIAGDLIFFSASGTSESHIGLVLYADKEKVYTVEGNTSDAAGLESNGGGVYVKSYDRKSDFITGYGVLPYKVNNDARKIDYSGATPTAGVYVATTNKYVYKTESATSYTWLLPRFSTFTVTGVADNGRLKVTCEIQGTTITGYVKNNTDRVIQLSVDPAIATRSDYQTARETWGYQSGKIDAYHLNASTSASAPATDALNHGDKLGLSGFVGFSRRISAVGYYFDGAKTAVTWDATALRAPDAAVTAAGGKYAMRYEIHADTAKTAAGSHTVTFVVRLLDGTVCAVETIPYTAKTAATAPAAPSVDTADASSVTLAALPGAEYRMNGGAWQSSPVFSGLTAGETYTFECRTAETATAYASAASHPLTVTLPEETVTTDAVTTDAVTTDAVTTDAVTTESITTEEVTTDEATSDADTDTVEGDITPEPAIRNGCNATVSLVPIALLIVPAVISMRKREE